MSLAKILLLMHKRGIFLKKASHRIKKAVFRISVSFLKAPLCCSITMERF
jgi:hypothetical protein